MDYISARQIAKTWEVSVRRVQQLCEQGRVEGAILFDHKIWMIPQNSTKPADMRIKHIKHIKSTNPADKRVKQVK